MEEALYGAGALIATAILLGSLVLAVAIANAVPSKLDMSEVNLRLDLRKPDDDEEDDDCDCHSILRGCCCGDLGDECDE